MFEFSFGELLVIFVAALLILGPKELPVVVRYIRDIVRAIRRTTASIQKQINEVLDEDELKETTRLIKGDDGAWYESYDLKSLIIEDKPQEQKDGGTGNG